MQHNLISPSFHFGERPSLRANKMESALRTEFSQVGTMARPAGVGGVMDVSASISTYGEMLAKGADRGAHALQTASPYAERAEPGWAPMEPTVKPSWSDKGAGTVSAGCIDNTYMPAPLKNKWGKQREMSKAEVVVLPHKQATDLLAVTLGTQLPLPEQTVNDIPTVREPYSKTIPLFHPIDPMRAEAGFVRGPNIIPGAKPPPESPLKNAPPVQSIPEDWKMRKLECAPASSMELPARPPVCHS
jgi:hypothetical protein